MCPDLSLSVHVTKFTHNLVTFSSKCSNQQDLKYRLKAAKNNVKETALKRAILNMKLMTFRCTF